jgi:hypothetical protein
LSHDFLESTANKNRTMSWILKIEPFTTTVNAGKISLTTWTLLAILGHGKIEIFRALVKYKRFIN